MREIEVKYRVDDLEYLLAALNDRGIKVGDPQRQDDQGYAPNGWQFGDRKLGVASLRLRSTAGRHYFTLKRPAQNEQACLEYETEVADREAMHHAAMEMGFQPTVRIVKTRRTASIGACSICIDELDGIGAFIEAERMAPDTADAEAVQAELALLVESLGVAGARVAETYDSLVHAAQRGER